jgi:lipoyl(octanoyl) transferase
MTVSQRGFELVKLPGEPINFQGISVGQAPLWRRSPEPVSYPEAVAVMERHVDAIRHHGAPELIWLTEHPPVYTAGTSARAEDLLVQDRFPVFQTGRGGGYTYHGPGQRVVYMMLDLALRGRDVRCYVRLIERWVIEALAHLGVAGHLREGRTGIWIARPEKGEGAEDKIAAIGVRVRRWVAFHGVSINVAPSLSHFSGINACGITDQGVTSLSNLGKIFSLDEVDLALAATFPNHFGPTAELESISGMTQAASNPKDLTL